jgi:quercetin dioxygenase-like cupin family protein
MIDKQPPPCLVSPSEGLVLRAFGEEAHFHLTGEQTGGSLTMWTETVPAQGGPPPHRHLNEDEWFIVQEGRFQFLVDGQWREVEQGAALYMPRGHVHAFKNIGASPGKLLISTSPSGFETFFSRCADAFNRPGPPDMKAIMDIAAEHGIEFVA